MPVDLPDPPWQPAERRRPTRQRPALTAERIVDVALAIVDAEGSDAVTMRRVAGELGVVASSLYAHISNREELLRLVVERVDDEMGAPEPSGDWKTDVRAHFVRSHEVLTSHGDVAALNFGTIPSSRRSLATFEALLQTLLAAGIDARTATWGLERLALYTTADALEVAEFARRHPDRGAALVRSVQLYFAALPAEEFPAIRAHSGMLMVEDHRERFGMGLDLLIAGMEAMSSRSAAELSTRTTDPADEP